MKKKSKKKHKGKQEKRAPVVISEPSREEPLPTPPLSNDSALSNTAWVKLAEECVELYVELKRYLQQFDPPRQEVAEHVCQRLTEILVRSGVDLIGDDGPFDRNLHERINPTTEPLSDAATARIVNPGFRISRRVLQRARVETSLNSNLSEPNHDKSAPGISDQS